MSPFWIIWLLGTVAIVAVAIYAVSRPHRERKRIGMAPGQGASLIDANHGAGGSSHGTVIRVTRDPQAYAKAFVPKNKK